MSKAKAVKKIKPVEIKPLFPRLVIERICKNEATTLGIIVTRLQKEETMYAYVFEPGENEDFDVADLVMVHPHCGHDFIWNSMGDNPMALTFIEPEDIMAKIEGTSKEKRAFIERARGAM